MQKKSEDFNDFSMGEAMRLAQSDAGQQLFALLQATQGEQLQAAMDQAAAGDYAGVKKTMQFLLADQQAQALLKQLRGDPNG